MRFNTGRGDRRHRRDAGDRDLFGPPLRKGARRLSRGDLGGNPPHVQLPRHTINSFPFSYENGNPFRNWMASLRRKKPREAELRTGGAGESIAEGGRGYKGAA